MPTSKPPIESLGLLRPESFDLDDLEASPTVAPLQNGHAHHPSREDWAHRARKTWKSAPPWLLRPRYIVIGLVTVAVLLFVGVVLNRGSGFKIPRVKRPPPPSPPLDGGEYGGGGKQWEKPEGFKIVGLIFFGRPSAVEILDCYLKKNLVTSGGWLDEVHFVVNTEKEDDIAYLDGLLKTSELYKKITIPKLGYNEVWEAGVQEENMYIKIDDDIVRFALLPSLLVWLAVADLRQSARYISMMKRFPILSTRNSTIRTPSTLSPTSSTAPKQAGYTTALAPSTPTFPS